jgi:hypothetical protein
MRNAQEDLLTDKYYLELSDKGKEILLKKMEGKEFACANSVLDVWHGEIKCCPKCEKIRVTGCSACGCGSCMTCGYRWSCNSSYITPVVAEKLLSMTDSWALNNSWTKPKTVFLIRTGCEDYDSVLWVGTKENLERAIQYYKIGWHNCFTEEFYFDKEYSDEKMEKQRRFCELMEKDLGDS